MEASVGHDSYVGLYRIPHLEGLDQRREIGRGSFGAVYEVKINGIACIAKGLHEILLGHGGNLPIREEDKKAIRAKFHNECALLGNLKHPNIVQFLGVHRSKDNDEWLVMEYLHMDLAKCLEMYPDISLQLKLSILRDVSYGLLHLHSQAPPIIHRDLTAPNILLTRGMSAKIADLGVSKIFDICQLQRSAHTRAPGTLAYMPPEALSPNPKYDAKLDVFSYGVLTLYVANQDFPIVYEPPIPPLVTKKQEIQIYKRKHWVDKMGVAHPLHSVVMSCLKDHPDHRPTSKELNDIITKLCAQHDNSCKNVFELIKENEELKAQRRKLEMVNVLKIQQSQPSSTTSSWYGTLAAGIGTSMAGIGSRMITAVVEKVVPDTLKEYDKDTCMSQINCQSTIVDGKEWLGVSKTKNPEDIKGDDDIAAKLHQIQTYKEDFENERKDRISACVKLNECKEQLQKKDQELADIKAQLQSVKDTMEELKIWEEKKLQQVTADLEAAKEEIAVKVAQVKQYQKQVEAYKQQLERNNEQTQAFRQQLDHMSKLKEQAEKKLTEVMRGSDTKKPMDLEFKPSFHSGTPIAASHFSTSEEDTATFPRTVRGNDLDTVQGTGLGTGLGTIISPHTCLPASVAGMQQHPLSAPPTGSDRVPSPRIFSPQPPPHAGPPSLDNLPHPSAMGGSQGISYPTLDQHQDEHVGSGEPTAPPDPNLTCPLCRLVFKKGEIQKFRLHVHVQECKHSK